MTKKQYDNETKWQWNNDISNDNGVMTKKQNDIEFSNDNEISNGNETKWQWNKMTMKQHDNERMASPIIMNSDEKEIMTSSMTTQ